ncbi:sensor histidine kinase [Streptomyces sp. NBC_00503]|uniref:sensor histidine kinase n=1 Tax=Streptomyces sp. NBC_00503 TaxID=2903659 RepID=UPI002E7FF49C|nr:histidine kinase [Streptomyces sp. NBC_00503]WUD85157.1 histidine kinase [Streptomyces sp. NBC_00503]
MTSPDGLRDRDGRGGSSGGPGGVPARQPGPAARPYRGRVLRTVPWLIRAAAFAVIGAGALYPASGADRSAHPVVVAAYVLCGGFLALWALLDVRGARGCALLPVAFTGMAVAGGFASPYPGGGTLLGLAGMAVIAAGSETDPPVGRVVTAAGIVSVGTGALLNGSGRGILLGFPLLLLTGLLMGRNRRAQRVRAEQNVILLAQAEELRAEQGRTAVLDERARIAREIHDVLAHSLGALGIQIQTARALLAGGDPRRADEILATAQRLTTEGLTETRRAVHALRSDLAPLPEALGELAEAHRRRHTDPVTVAVEGGPVQLPPEQVLCLLRAAGEALTNAAKHAPGRPVGVTLSYEDHAVTLTVRNPLGSDRGDGRSPREAAAGKPGFRTVDGGFGLTGMRERLLLVGGALTAGVRNGEWTVTAAIPRTAGIPR